MMKINSKYKILVWIACILAIFEVVMRIVPTIFWNKDTKADEINIIYMIHELGLPPDAKVIDFDKSSVLGGDRIFYCDFYSSEKIDFYLSKIGKLGWNISSANDDYIQGDKSNINILVHRKNDGEMHISIYSTRTAWGIFRGGIHKRLL